MEADLICPRCGSDDTAGRGCGRRLCHRCGRTYGPATGTVMSSAKLSERKLRLMVNMMLNDCKLKAICDAVGISTRTAYVWRMKVYAVAFEIQKGAKLSGVCYIDEKLIPVNEGLVYRRPDGRLLRGVSRNQVCVACGVDEEGRRFAEVAGRGHITSKQCLETYGRHISKGSLIVHDGIHGHAALVAELDASEDVHKSSEPDYHPAMQPIDSFHSEIAHWLEVHRGLRTEYLPVCLAWIAFKSSIKEGGIWELVDELVALCFQTKTVFRIKDRYRL